MSEACRAPHALDAGDPLQDITDAYGHAQRGEVIEVVAGRASPGASIACSVRSADLFEGERHVGGTGR